MKRIFILILLSLALTASFSTTADADDLNSLTSTDGSSGGSSGGSGVNNDILSFFGAGSNISCYSTPTTNCDENPQDGLFNSIGCKVMKSFDAGVVPLYCNIIANPTYLEAVDAAMLLYVIFTGFGFLTGILQVELGVVIGRLLKASIVYAFAVNADIYFSIVYNTVLTLPEDIVRILLSSQTAAGGTDVGFGTSGGTGAPQNFFQFVDQGIYKVFSDVVQPSINEASGSTYSKSNLKVVLMGLALWQVGGDVVGGLFMTVVVGWLVAYFGIMIRYLVAQLALLFLLMLGPLFIPLLLFKRFEDLTYGWISMMVAFIVQIMLVVAFVVLVQHFFVDFYNIIKKGMDASPMQESQTNRLVKYGQNTWKVDSTPGYSDQSAATAVNGMLGGDWTSQLPNLTVQIIVMGVITWCAAQFLKFVPSLASALADNVQAGEIFRQTDLNKGDWSKLIGKGPREPQTGIGDVLMPVR